jgi:hypothetical protein
VRDIECWRRAIMSASKERPIDKPLDDDGDMPDL